MARQLFDVEFDPDGRTYCYHYEGPEQIARGAILEVQTRRGKCNVKVVGLRDEPPKRADGKSVETVSILRIIASAE